MALTNIKIPSASADVVAVFDQNFSQVFSNARPIKATVMETSKVMEHPVENGTTITDHRIIDPIEIELSMVLLSGDYRSTYQQVKQLFKAGALLTVQTKSDSYQNMLIQQLPHDEDPEIYDTIILAVRLKEVNIVTAQFGTLPASKVANKSNASTVGKGELQTTTPTAPRQSTAYQGYTSFKNWITKTP